MQYARLVMGLLTPPLLPRGDGHHTEGAAVKDLHRIPRRCHRDTKGAAVEDLYRIPRRCHGDIVLVYCACLPPQQLPQCGVHDIVTISFKVALLRNMKTPLVNYESCPVS